MEQDDLSKWTELKHSKCKVAGSVLRMPLTFSLVTYTIPKIHTFIAGQPSPRSLKRKVGKLNNLDEG
jgi:hypothetical protein